MKHGIALVQRVKMQPGRATLKQLAALSSGVLDTVLADGVGIVADVPLVLPEAPPRRRTGPRIAAGDPRRLQARSYIIYTTSIY